MAGHAQKNYGISARRASFLMLVSTKAMRYKPVPRPDNDKLKQELQQLGTQYPRYGYLLLHAMLKARGLVQNRKRTYRIYRQLGMQVRTRKRGKLVRPRYAMPVPTGPNQRWSMDFISDQLAGGRRIRVLNIMDDYSRVCVTQIVDTSISGQRLANHLDKLAVTRGLPRSLVMDNGPEFTSKAMFFWSQKSGVSLNFIQPGKPTQNAFVESFNGKFRDNCLNQHWFKNISDARRIISVWRDHYNGQRPHSSLDYRSPLEYENKVA